MLWLWPENKTKFSLGTHQGRPLGLRRRHRLGAGRRALWVPRWCWVAPRQPLSQGRSRSELPWGYPAPFPPPRPSGGGGTSYVPRASTSHSVQLKTTQTTPPPPLAATSGGVAAHSPGPGGWPGQGPGQSRPLPSAEPWCPAVLEAARPAPGQGRSQPLHPTPRPVVSALEWVSLKADS